MGKSKITNFVIALVWISFLASMFTLFISGLTTNYGVTFDENETAVFNEMQDLTDRIEDYQEDTQINLQDPSITDIVGGFFSSAYNALRTTTDSINVFFSMGTAAFANDSLDLGIAGNSLWTAIWLTVIVFIFVGVLIRGIMKVDI